MGMFTTILTVTALAAAAAGKIMEGQQAAEAAEYNQALYEQRADIIKQRQALELKRGERERRLLAGKITARAAKMGVDFGGSPMEVFLDTMTQFELDEQIEQYNLEVERRQVLSAAERTGFAAKQYRRQGMFNAFSTILMGGMSAYNAGLISFGGKTGSTIMAKAGTALSPGAGPRADWMGSRFASRAVY